MSVWGWSFFSKLYKQRKQKKKDIQHDNIFIKSDLV